GLGIAIGSADTGDASTHHAYFVADSFVDLGALGGKNSAAYDVNDNGQVVGEADTAGGAHHAFRTASFATAIDPAKDDLGTLGGQNSVAYAEDPNGVVVGQADTTSGAHHAFRAA